MRVMFKADVAEQLLAYILRVAAPAFLACGPRAAQPHTLVAILREPGGTRRRLTFVRNIPNFDAGEPSLWELGMNAGLQVPIVGQGGATGRGAKHGARRVL